MSKAKLLKTGIHGLDEFLGGGLPDGSLILVTGDPGSSFDLLAQQILYTRAKEGSPVTYLVDERDPQEVLEDMSLFGFDIASLDNWKFIDAYTPRHWHPPVVETLSVVLRELVPSIKEGACTAVDSLSYLLHAYDFNRVLEVVNSIKRKSREEGGLHFFLLLRGRHDPAVTATLSHLADAVFEVELTERGEQLVKLLRIIKLRRALYESRSLPMKLTPRGLIVEFVKRVA